MQSTQTIPLSIIIATIKPGPDIRNCLISLYNQAQAVDAEVIIADGSTQGQPDDLARSYPKVNWLNKPGASVFYLRGLAMTQARGEIIAVTEDHCQVTLGWCERIIQAHKDYPDAAAIGGAVENGPGEHLIDWANFFLLIRP